MSYASRPNVSRPDDFDVLSAVWILASNDDDPIITYRGIIHRLGLTSDYPIKGIVRARGDLFRAGLSAGRLKEWKSALLEGRRLPSWLKEIEPKSKRDELIKGITDDDVFRSQFRTEVGALRSDIQIIEWGLRHIDRLRVASTEARRQSATSAQVWLVFAVGIANILISMFAK